MAIRDNLKHLWKRQRISKLRVVSKKKLAQWRATREQVRIENQKRLELEQIEAALKASQLEALARGQESDQNDDLDPRFIVNPTGEGCSKSFENRLSIGTSDSDITHSTLKSVSSRAAQSVHGSDDDHFPSSLIDQKPLFDLCTWSGPESLRIDQEKGKRKRKASADEIEELRLMKDYLREVEAGIIIPEDGWTRTKIMAVMRGRAWSC